MEFNLPVCARLWRFAHRIANGPEDERYRWSVNPTRFAVLHDPEPIRSTSGCHLRVILTAKHMPKGPKGQKRPADVISNAFHVMRIATGEIEETLTEDGKNSAAVALGRKGGLARAERTSKAERVKIAKKGAKARWGRAKHGPT